MTLQTLYSPQLFGNDQKRLKCERDTRAKVVIMRTKTIQSIINSSILTS
jgi:hypothetical protein